METRSKVRHHAPLLKLRQCTGLGQLCSKPEQSSSMVASTPPLGLQLYAIRLRIRTYEVK
jgi:hypothetical protein